MSSNDLKTVVEWIDSAENIVFFIGAGFSVASGIKTFRGSMGLWTFGKDFMKWFFILFVISSITTFIFRNFSSIYRLFYIISVIFIILTIISPIVPWIGLILVGTPIGWSISNRISWYLFKNFFYDALVMAKPNEGHRFISFLEKNYDEKKISVITQNVDDLESKGGYKGENMFQLHGSYMNFFCTSCGKKYINRFTGKLPNKSPKCEKCGKRSLRTGCLLFLDGYNPFYMPFDESSKVVRQLSEKDLFIIIGTSGMVAPANQYPHWVKSRILEVNIQKSSSFGFDGNDFLYIRGEQDKVFMKIKEEMLKK